MRRPLVHAGLLRVSGRAPDGVFFELGLRPGTSPLVRYRAGDISADTRSPAPGVNQRALRGAEFDLGRRFDLHRHGRSREP